MIVVPGNPVSVNHAYRTGSGDRGMARFAHFLTREAKTWKETVAWAARADWRKPPLTGSVGLVITLYYADNRRRDIDNAGKLLLDGLAGIVYLDDRQVDDLRFIREHDKKKPRVEIKVSELS